MIALVAGASGLVGAQLLPLLLDDPYYTKVVAVTRRPLEQLHPKLENVVMDFEKLEAYDTALTGDHVYCCLGTTIKKVKTKEAFRRVDHDYPVMIGKAALENGASKYLLVSALGADKHSRIFYNRVKGEVESIVAGLGYKSVHIFRPSFLEGDRDEHRSAEKAAATFFRYLGFLVPLAYKPVKASAVAAAMLYFGKAETGGVAIHESKELQAY